MRETLALMVFILCLSGLSWAANFSDPVDGVFMGVYGNTISVEIPSLVSKSPVSGNQNGEITFQLTPDTAYTNFSQLTDLQKGETVRVEYYQDATGKTKGMIASAIAKVGTTVMESPSGVTSSQAPVTTQTTTTTTTTVIPQQ